MKCLDQLAYLAELKGVPRARGPAARGHAGSSAWASASGASARSTTLSKGMQQKIQFAATFIFEPDLVILDEVFSGLDPLNIELLREMILEEKAKGTTILFSTHMLAEAEKICDAICLIEGGEVILDGTLDEVRADFPLALAAGGLGRRDPNRRPICPACAIVEQHEGSWRLTLDEGTDPRGPAAAC